MALPVAFKDELVARSDIVDVVSDYVTLTPKGGSFWGLCPFHSEKTPSFSVSADKQIFKCFGCGKGGGAINFVMEMENLPFRDAVEVLAKRAGLEMPADTGGPSAGARARREKLLAINKQAARTFHKWLYEPEGAQGLEYLRKRGLSQRTLTRFGLGFAPNRWDALIEALAQEGYDKRDLLDAGLAVNNKDGRIYDRFRNRVMFPIIDIRGEVIGFGGRVMDDSTPKYLNSPDTPVYNKSRNVFALNIAKKSKAGRVILTEGYMDTISLHQAGFDSAVASLGTSLTSEHAQLLSRYFPEAIISYDGDGAGIAAAQRAIPLLEKAGLKVRVLRVTGAKDPDEFIKTYGRDAFARLLDQSENQVDYRLDQLKTQYNLEDDAQRVAFLQDAAQLLSTLSSPVEREIYTTRAAETAKITPEAMRLEVQRAFKRRLSREKRQELRRDLNPAVQLQPKERELRYDNIRSARAEEGILRLLIRDESLFPEEPPLREEQFSSPLLGRAFTTLWQAKAAGRVPSLAAQAEFFSQEEMNHLTGVCQQPESLRNGQQALADYIRIVQTEAEKRLGGGTADPLLAATEKYKDKKGTGGKQHGK